MIAEDAGSVRRGDSGPDCDCRGESDDVAAGRGGVGGVNAGLRWHFIHSADDT